MIIAIFLLGVIALCLAFLSITLYQWIKGRRAAGDRPGLGTGAMGAAAFELRRSFALAAARLRKSFPGRHFRYRLPWFVALGETQSGKTSIFRNSGLNMPFGEPVGDRSGAQWWFFDGGIVIDLNGDLVLRQDGTESAERSWASFLRLLHRHRPKRALDGAIVSLPATDLMDYETLGGDQARVKADALRRKLNQLEREIGIAFPVYVVITKCDYIPGFRHFCSEIPARFHNNIFGWSNPRDPKAAYSSEWVDEAFTTLRRRIGQLQMEASFDGLKEITKENFFLFPQQFAKLAGALRVSLDSLFGGERHDEPLMFRGVYFAGQAFLPQEEDRADRIAYRDQPAVRRPAASPLPASIEGRPSFVADLLNFKIFPEFRLARPTARKIAQRKRANLYLKIAMAALLLTIPIGVYFSHASLQDVKNALTQALKGIRDDSVFTRKDRDDQPRLQIDDQHLVSAMDIAEPGAMFSFFFPSSWFSDIEREVHDSIVAGYERVVLDSMGEKLREKAEALTADFRERSPGSEIDGVALPVSRDPMSLFEDFRNYFAELTLLETGFAQYNSLKNEYEPDKLKNLVKYCFGLDLGDAEIKKLEQYQDAFDNFEPIEFERRTAATLKAENMFSDFLENLFRPSALLLQAQTDLLNVTRDRKSLLEEPEEAETALRDLLSLLQIADELVRSEPLGLGEESPGLGPEFDEAMTRVESSSLVNSALHDTLAWSLDIRYKGFKGQLNPDFMEQALAFKEPIRAFFELEFLKADANEALPVNRADFEDWNRQDLIEALGFCQAYLDFEEKQLASLPQGDWLTILRQRALANLDEACARRVARAPITGESLLKWPTADIRREKQAVGQIQDFLGSADSIDKLLGHFKELGFDSQRKYLLEIADNEAVKLLLLTDTLLQDDLYFNFGVGEWDGESPLVTTVFQLSDEQAIALYLETQRDRVRHLARSYAAPLTAIMANTPDRADYGDRALLEKWIGVLEGLDAYEKSLPEATLVQLETFFLTEANNIAMDNCEELAGTYAPSSDYFLDRLNRLKARIHERCQEIRDDVEANAYDRQTLAFNQNALQFFHDYLAGAFPFASPDSLPTGPEADPLAIQEFYRLYNEHAPEYRRTIASLPDPPPEAEETLIFMDKVEAVFHFLRPLMLDESGSYQLAFNLEIINRVNRSQEKMASQIIEWKVELAELAMQFEGDRALGVWTYGDPVAVKLRWANGAPNQPLDVRDNPWLMVEDGVATFRFDGAWSLLRLLARHRLRKGEPGWDPARPEVLKLTTPTAEADDDARGPDAIAFIRAVAKLEGEAKAAPYPDFPTAAPSIFHEYANPGPPPHYQFRGKK